MWVIISFFLVIFVVNILLLCLMEQETAKTPREIGRIVSMYFKEQGISQLEVSLRLGLASKQVVSNQLHGKRFGPKVAAKYAKEFGFNELFLITGKGSLKGGGNTEQDHLLEENAKLRRLVESQRETINSLYELTEKEEKRDSKSGLSL